MIRDTDKGLVEIIRLEDEHFLRPGNGLINLKERVDLHEVKLQIETGLPRGTEIIVEISDDQSIDTPNDIAQSYEQH